MVEVTAIAPPTPVAGGVPLRWGLREKVDVQLAPMSTASRQTPVAARAQRWATFSIRLANPGLHIPVYVRRARRLGCGSLIASTKSTGGACFGPCVGPCLGPWLGPWLGNALRCMGSAHALAVFAAMPRPRRGCHRPSRNSGLGRSIGMASARSPVPFAANAR